MPLSVTLRLPRGDGLRPFQTVGRALHSESLVTELINPSHCWICAYSQRNEPGAFPGDILLAMAEITRTWVRGAVSRR